jgi:hypothetical protein
MPNLNQATLKLYVHQKLKVLVPQSMKSKAENDA